MSRNATGARKRLQAIPFEVSPVREIERSELAQLAQVNPQRQRIKNLVDKHHRVARLIASGLSHAEVAEITGRSTASIRLYSADPAFQELVEAYRPKINAQFERGIDEFTRVATSNMLMAEAMIQDKLEAAVENEEFLPTRDLLAISRDAADRLGYGKKSTNVNVNVDFAAKLEAMNKRTAKVIEGRGVALPAKTGQRSPETLSSVPTPLFPVEQAPSKTVEMTAVELSPQGHTHVAETLASPNSALARPPIPPFPSVLRRV